MNILAIIQARMNSERLPNKVLKPLNGKTMLEQIIERVKKSTYINQIVVATTTQKEDKVIGNILKDYDITVYYGNIYNVLDRFYQVAKQEQADIIVRLTADNPFIDSTLIDEAIQMILEHSKIEYIRSKGYPLGMNIEVFTFKALETSFEKATLSYEKEHVTPYIYGHPEQFTIKELFNNENLEYIRLTCDTEEDYMVIKTIYNDLKDSPNLKREAFFNYLKNNPQLMQVNAHIKQKELKEIDKRGEL